MVANFIYRIGQFCLALGLLLISPFILLLVGVRWLFSKPEALMTEDERKAYAKEKWLSPY